MQSMKLSLLGLAAIMAATAACAQTNAAPTNTDAAVFKSADTNLDGQVSRDEFSGHVKKSTFARVDSNNDGTITLAEWKAVDRTPEAENNFAAMDKNRNGRISYPEFSDTADWKSALNDSFKSLDRDRDSHLAPSEMTGRPMFKLLSVSF